MLASCAWSARNRDKKQGAGRAWQPAPLGQTIESYGDPPTLLGGRLGFGLGDACGSTGLGRRLRVGAADEDKEESTNKRKLDQPFHCDAILSKEVLNEIPGRPHVQYY